MDPAIVSASAAVLGSLAGGSASLATAWLNQRTQGKRASVLAETHKRELLYSDFITEGSRLALDSLEHNLDRPETFLQAYSLLNRIRLTSSEPVLRAAEAAVEEIFEKYRSLNVPIERLRELTPEKDLHDPLKKFSEACRDELESLKRTGM